MKIHSIYDNKGETLDRFTIYFNPKNKINGLHDCLCLCSTGVSVNMFSQGQPGKHNGDKLTFNQLPIELQTIIKERGIKS